MSVLCGACIASISVKVNASLHLYQLIIYYLQDLAVPLQVVPSLREVQIKGPVANIPGKDSPLAATLSTSSCDQSRAQGPDEKQEEESLLQVKLPEIHR